MSVVAAAALSDSVLVTSDCRLTAIHGDGREVHYDNTLKVFPCGPMTVIGFVGNDVRAAALIVRELLRQTARRRRRVRKYEHGRSLVPWHPSSLHRWIPRFLRTTYRRTKSEEPLQFLVASVLPYVPSVVSTAKVRQLLSECAKRGWGPNWVMQVMQAGGDTVALLGTFAPRILLMESPDFHPAVYGPLSFVAIGSGAQAAIGGVGTYTAGLFAGGHPEWARFHLDVCVAGECARAGISTVGGLRPTYELSAAGLTPLPRRSTKRTDKPDEESVELAFVNGGRWVQRNLTTGKSIDIVPPWVSLRNLDPSGVEVDFDMLDWHPASRAEPKE